MLDLRRMSRPAAAFFPYLPELRRELDRVFDGFMGDGADGVRPFPALNVWEDGERIYIEAEVPGLTLEQLEITVTGNELGLRGRRQPHTAEQCVYHRQERGVGEFTRFLTLPFEVDAENVDATLRNGVLTITMPKAERARARKITVKAE